MSTTTNRPKPADRKPKVFTVKVDDDTYTVPLDALDDFELLDDLNAIQDGDGARLPTVLRRLLGAEQYRAALESLRSAETGRVSLEAGASLVERILEGIKS